MKILLKHIIKIIINTISTSDDDLIIYSEDEIIYNDSE